MVRIKPFLRPQQLRTAFTPLNRLSPFQTLQQQQTRLSSTHPPHPPAIPPPTPFVPDVTTFLRVIGRGLLTHASKFPTWDALFSLTSDQLRELGVEPPRTRRYLLQWRQRFRRGQYGIGGDLQHVTDGQATLAVYEAPATDKASAVEPRKYVVNVPAGRAGVRECAMDEISRVRGYKVQGAKTIVGPYALPLQGGEGARVTVTEGMWEDRRGHKIDGGERRRTQIRYKKRIAERREMRERGEL
ncbi:IGR protein motif-domain-containing protein [Annulohypoxylon maeteangense]|uniref:IGR protein motif-domain-containing protein n=1 Tax=Annulohypoxylon maeteangense TaxID=1927788 RepID=UPI002007ABFD|nr:IGR protein motif-domain-containing protein [Annulohypoxylon maeteangense]KAI0885264.1 IGR protein motif-domain-containing protein [Annulohypoxylon maeteangense]